MDEGQPLGTGPALMLICDDGGGVFGAYTVRQSRLTR